VCKILIDICIWLDLDKAYQQQALLSALESYPQERTVLRKLNDVDKSVCRQ
jgi:hypothetical protein